MTHGRYGFGTLPIREGDPPAHSQTETRGIQPVRRVTPVLALLMTRDFEIVAKVDHLRFYRILASDVFLA